MDARNPAQRLGQCPVQTLAPDGSIGIHCSATARSVRHRLSSISVSARRIKIFRYFHACAGNKGQIAESFCWLFRKKNTPLVKGACSAEWRQTRQSEYRFHYTNKFLAEPATLLSTAANQVAASVIRKGSGCDASTTIRANKTNAGRHVRNGIEDKAIVYFCWSFSIE